MSLDDEYIKAVIRVIYLHLGSNYIYIWACQKRENHFEIKKGCKKTSYQRIAELVHELVKTSKSMLQDKELALGQLKMNEFTSIQRFFLILRYYQGMS